MQVFTPRKPSSPFKKIISILTLSSMAVFLSACSDDDKNNEKTGFVKFYNASSDSPAIFLTIDEDVDTDEDDEFEQTFSSVSYGSAGSRIQLENQEYFYELAWQDEDSQARTDLEIIAEDSIFIETDTTHWIVMSGSVDNPEVTILDIPERTDDEAEEDAEDDVFNLRLVNLHTAILNVDVYISESDETFNEANLLVSLTPRNLSDNFTIDEDQYKFYITRAGSTDVLFTSDEVDYSFGGQFLVAIRDNAGAGGSPFVIDNINSSTITAYDALESTANIAVYSGLGSNDLVENYSESVDIQIEGATEISDIDDLQYREFSEIYTVDSGDYRFTVSNPNNDEVLLLNRILSLPKNESKTLFLYWTDEAVDDDGDGIVDEDEDGVVDEYRPVISSLVVDNSQLLRLYDKELTLLNLTNTDDFDLVVFYFVESDEIISTTDNSRNVVQGNTNSITLLNNTYSVFAVATIDGNEIILDELSLTLDEDSPDLFLLIEHDDASSSGFSIQVAEQSFVSTDD